MASNDEAGYGKPSATQSDERSLDGRLPRIRRESESTAELVARELMRYIVSSEDLRAGDRLPSERHLAAAFGVGRNAVREALKSLSILGLLDIRPGSGAFLVPPESELLPRILEIGLLLREQRVADMIEIRALLEVATARLAAERRDDHDIEELEDILEQMPSVSDDPEAFADLDIAFHVRLAESARNETLTGLLLSVQALLRIWIMRVKQTQTDDFVAPHVAIFKAIQQGDPLRAENAMREHMDDARDRLEATLPPSDNEPAGKASAT